VYASNRIYKRNGLNAICKLEVLLGDCSRRDSSNCLPRTPPFTTTVCLHSLLLQVCPVRMTRLGIEVHCGGTVVFGSLVLISEHLNISKTLPFRHNG
jgi:hypothetical protein